MALFRKKPVVVEAEQWFPGKQVEGVIDLRNQVVREGWGVMTAHGQMALLAPGDYVIKEMDSCGYYPCYYSCKPDIFELTYEPVAVAE